MKNYEEIMQKELKDLKEDIENSDVKIEINKIKNDVEVNCKGDPEIIISVLLLTMEKIKNKYAIADSLYNKLIVMTSTLNAMDQMGD